MKHATCSRLLSPERLNTHNGKASAVADRRHPESAPRSAPLGGSEVIVCGGKPIVREPRASIHFDGSVTVAFAVGGHRNGPDSYMPGWQFDSAAVEGAIAD